MDKDMKKDLQHEEGDKVLAGLPYLYRSKGLPSEVYEIRFKTEIEQALLEWAVSDTILRYPYFSVKLVERKGDFYYLKNDLPLQAFHMNELVPLGGKKNNYHLMGVNYDGKLLMVSFHHGLTDGRGAKNFVETLVQFYWDYYKQKKEATAGEIEGSLNDISKKHHAKIENLSVDEYKDPFVEKYDLEGSQGKVHGLERKAMKLPEMTDKSGHRRYELRFPQKEFMDVCKQYGASPIILLSILMSRGIQKVHPENDIPINSNFPMDARKILGCDRTFKNCVKSMSLPYRKSDAEMSVKELASKYKELLEAQKDHDYCAKEFNNIIMFLGLIGHFHSFKGRQKLLSFMENLALDTYLISYIGQFDVPDGFVDSVHLYSSCTDGLVLNMTCQSGAFIIDLTQDFEGYMYADALKGEFEREGISIEMSGEILFETPYDEIEEIITPAAEPGEQLKNWLERFADAAKTSTQTAKERAAQAQAMSPAVTAMYYDLATGTMKKFDPTQNTKQELEKLVRNAPSIFIP